MLICTQFITPRFGLISYQIVFGLNVRTPFLQPQKNNALIDFRDILFFCSDQNHCRLSVVNL
nr:MAG TPA: hypothetical protein [Caudoviricetes sp.]